MTLYDILKKDDLDKFMHYREQCDDVALLRMVIRYDCVKIIRYLVNKLNCQLPNWINLKELTNEYMSHIAIKIFLAAGYNITSDMFVLLCIYEEPLANLRELSKKIDLQKLRIFQAESFYPRGFRRLLEFYKCSIQLFKGLCDTGRLDLIKCIEKWPKEEYGDQGWCMYHAILSGNFKLVKYLHKRAFTIYKTDFDMENTKSIDDELGLDHLELVLSVRYRMPIKLQKYVAKYYLNRNHELLKKFYHKSPLYSY